MKAVVIMLFIFLLLLTKCEYGNDVFEPPIDYTGETGFVTDIDGNTYKTVGIGTQIWMAENLKTSRLKNSTELPYVSDGVEWNSLMTPAYCWYQNDSANFTRYGALYNFYAVKTDSLCPEGWRIPDQDDLNVLTNYLGGSKVAAGKLKSYAQGSWESPNYCFDNNYHFAALPGGIRRYFSGQFMYKGHQGYWWCSEETTEIQAFCYEMSGSSTKLSINTKYKKEGLSVRCIKDTY